MVAPPWTVIAASSIQLPQAILRRSAPRAAARTTFLGVVRQPSGYADHLRVRAQYQRSVWVDPLLHAVGSDG